MRFDLQKTRGFTIVELLIVIVVIAILAAITVVAFNGIKDRANKSSLSSDLANAAKQLRVASADTGTFPTTFPSDTKASSGNVLSMTAVSNSSTDFCINGFGPANLVMSVSQDTPPREAPCSGGNIGAPIGGTVPSHFTTLNQATNFANWTLSGGVTYNSTTNELQLSSTTSGTAVSPLVYANGAATCRIEVQSYATLPSPLATPQTQVYAGSWYYGNDGTTLVNNTSNYTGNGNAQNFSMNTWFNYGWSTPCGPNVKYVKFRIHSDPTSRTSDNRYRNPVITVF